jgi:cbb3-type cytochrome oxidase subunit 3
MMDSDDPMFVNLMFIYLLIFFCILIAIWFFFFRETEEKKQERLRQRKLRAEQEERERQRREAERLERERKKAEAKKKFDSLVSQGMPRSVARAHREFMADNPLPKGRTWYGEDISPLTFYGYRVGKARGLRQSERREIIRYVLRARLTDPLAQTYQVSWGRPLSRQRRNAIVTHIDKLAAQRSSRRGYEVAVAEWIADSDWAKHAMDEEIKEFGGYGFQ